MLGMAAYGAAAAVASGAEAAGPVPPSGLAILQDLKSFQQMATVLMIAAHPDDENTQLITYLARGRGYRMAYLSVTRGDGGQNLLGPEFGDELGLIRTEELLAARRLDSGRQFFTRAIDFGFSKDPQETLRTWDRDAVLGDVVRVIRTFRPDVIVTRFAPNINNLGTHGHHTGSAILGVDAFKIAGDATKYPEQLTPAGGGLTPWQPKRIFLNGGGGGGRGGGGGGLSIDAGGIDPVLNEGFGSISNRSRAMHKSQGFGQGPGGGGGGTGPAPQAFSLLDGEAATTDIMDGIDTTWARVDKAGGNGVGARIAKATADTVAAFDPKNPSASVPALLAIKKDVDGLPADPIVQEKAMQLNRIIADCLGITVETVADKPEVIPGEAIKLRQTATMTAAMPVKWLGSVYPRSTTRTEQEAAFDLKANLAVVHESQHALVATPVSQPYWLRSPSAAGISTVEDPKLIGQPENPPAFPIVYSFEVGGQKLLIEGEPIVRGTWGNSVLPRRLDVIAPVALEFPFEVRLFAPGAAKPVEVEVTAYRAGAKGTVQLDLPQGWTASPATQAFTLNTAGEKTKVTFTVTPPAGGASADITAKATVDGKTYNTGRKEIAYAHIPFLLLQPQTRLRAVAADIAIKGKTVGYIPGAGDSVAQCLEQMGYAVKTIEAKDVNADSLRGLDAVVIGVRAYDTRGADLNAARPALTAFVEGGGNLIAQYNRQGGPQVGPYQVRVANIRTTDETAKPTFLAPDNPAMTGPNKITEADFANWVQERGIYYPQTWDAAFTPLLAFADPNEQPANGSLLVAKAGKGNVVYTSLVFFRQLPAGNPGAYRLFANLVSLGK
jgi:LmbE family N-acetylglucosaminyl deacetylase